MNIWKSEFVTSDAILTCQISKCLFTKGNRHYFQFMMTLALPLQLILNTKTAKKI